MTHCGFCDVLALSRYTSGRPPSSSLDRMGKSARIAAVSRRPVGVAAAG
jgi:hypothetical protein